MLDKWWKGLIIFILGMLTFAIGSYLVNTFHLFQRPAEGQTIEDWEQICLWQDGDGVQLLVSPKGCFSTSCTEIMQQVGTATVDIQDKAINIQTHFVLNEISGFPLPCADNCSGGGNIIFTLNNLIPDQYKIFYGAEVVGEVDIFSGRQTPRQCFENGMD